MMHVIICVSSKSPELLKWLKDFLGYKECGLTEAVPQSVGQGKERISGELAMEIGGPRKDGINVYGCGLRLIDFVILDLRLST